ncbi:cytochrome c oxidase assembly protein [Streptomyces sp. NPDC058622]|uniref:cytochrome c oxidase assembly protein n=1 Tax=Streptomyces sp. NPDC058622 TaxID=3346562 RepID=UPI00365646E2
MRGAPRRPPHLGRLFVLILTMPLHSWFGISVMSSTDIIGAGWWEAAGRTWGPSLTEDQYNGGTDRPSRRRHPRPDHHDHPRPRPPTGRDRQTRGQPGRQPDHAEES